MLTRRQFGLRLGGAATLAGIGPARLAAAVARPALDQAMAAIAAYAEQHRAYMNLPGLTLGIAIPGGPPLVRHFGYAELGARTPITDQTLFQVGSISKLMVAAVIHQMVSEGRFSLTDTIAKLMPDIPVPAGDGITVQQLLDHVSGLPADAPLFPPGGLWTGFKPGTHWSYSNTGYDILGKLAEHYGQKPLDRLLDERLFKPLGMAMTAGAITSDKRTRFAQGYEAADNFAPFVRGTPLAPAAWVDVTFAAGSVTSTASDMTILMRSLASAAQGKGGMGLSPAAGLAYTHHQVPSDSPAMHYGNGLMHVGTGNRTYLHHTGGMVSFSSSFHLDPVTGVGAFASSTISAFAAYRPRQLTIYAVGAINAALAGKPLPTPAALTQRLANAGDYVGNYSGPAGTFEVRSAPNGLAIIADGREAALDPWGEDIFRTLHPRFRQFSLMFERPQKTIAGASWGEDSFTRAGSSWKPGPSDPALRKLAGRYIDDSPWWVGATIVERGGKLWFGTEVPMTTIGDNLWRLGAEDWSPERVTFANPIDGRPQSMFVSGEKFVRHDI